MTTLPGDDNNECSTEASEPIQTTTDNTQPQTIPSTSEITPSQSSSTSEINDSNNNDNNSNDRVEVEENDEDDDDDESTSTTTSSSTTLTSPRNDPSSSQQPSSYSANNNIHKALPTNTYRLSRDIRQTITNSKQRSQSLLNNNPNGVPQARASASSSSSNGANFSDSSTTKNVKHSTENDYKYYESSVEKNEDLGTLMSAHIVNLINGTSAASALNNDDPLMMNNTTTANNNNNSEQQQQLCRTLEIEIEKSKTVNKFFIENRDDSAIKDLFSQNCLHLYNGEFTVLKHNEKDFVEAQQENVANNTKCLMYHEQGKDIMDLATKRITFHPNDFIEDQLNLLTKIYRFRLEAGELEPYFLSLELVNAKTRAKISERFYFHMTSHQLINSFYDELEVKKQLQKQLDHQPKALFSLSHFLKGEPLSDVYAVVFVFKTLQGVSTDQTLKQYHAGKKNHTLTKDTQSECLSGSQTFDDFQGLKHHKEPFLFSFCPVKESGIHAMRYFLPVENLFQLMSSSEAEVTEGSVGTKKLSHIDAVCEIISQQPESLIHFYTPHNVHERSELKEQLLTETEIAKKNIKKYKPVPGYLVFETYKFNPKKFESDPVERVLLFGSEQEKPIFTTSSAISLEEVIIKIQQRNGSILNPRDPTQEKELKKCLATSDSISYQNYKIEELHEKLPKFPHFDFSHLLYISPLTLNLEKFKIESLSCLDADPALLETLAIKKFKPKNVLVKVEYRESIRKSAQRIISPHGQSLVSEIYCNVVFDADKIIRFLDEIKIALPLPMEKENHLVISLYHLVIEKQGPKRKKTLDSNGNVPKICFGYAVLPIKDIVENHCSKMTDFTYTYTLPIYQKLTGDYLSDSKRLSVSASANIGSMSQKRYDIKKISFVCNTRVASTIYPNEKLLLQFFSDCAPFISITKEGSDSKELSRAVKDCRRSIENLTKVPFSKLVSHFTLIMDMLLSVMCRIPDVIHTFVSESEQQDNTSVLFGDTTHGLSLTGSSGEDEMLKSISARFGLAESTSPVSNSASLDHKSLSSILAAKRKSVTNSVTNSNSSSSHLSLTNPNHPSSANTPVSPSASGELKKRFSLKNILKRKSKEVEPTPTALHTLPLTTKKIPQPGDEGFNLIEYLKAQQEQQEQTQHTPEVSIPPKDDKSKNDKLKKRMSITDRLFNRNKPLDQSSEESNSSPIAEASSSSSGVVRKSITFTASNTDSRGSQSDFGDFLGITATLFELQKTVFQVIVSMLKGAAIITDCSERSNKLLNTYVNYVFKDIVMTQSPVYVNLVDLFTDVLGKADDELTVSVAVDENDGINQLYQTGEPKRNMGGIRKSIQDRFSNKRASLNDDSSVTINTPKNRNSYSMNMSLFALSSSPVFFESLQFCWFFLDLILKSYMLTQREKNEKRSAMNDVEFNLLSEREREALTSDHGYKFTLLLKELIGALAEKAVFYKDDFANFFVSSQINNQLAFFFRDLLGCGDLIKHEYVFDLMESYFREFTVKKPVTINTIKLCIDFLQILSDHPQFAELNLSIFHPKEYIHHESILCPPVKLLVNLIRDCITKFKSEIDVHNSAVKILRYILTKEEYTHLSIPNVTTSRAELIARIYFPYIVMLLKNFHALESIPEMTTRQHLKISVWILSNVNPQFFDDWIKTSEQNVIDNLVKLLAFYLDHYEIKGRIKYETSTFKAFQLVFSRLSNHLKERVVSIINKFSDDIKAFEPSHRDLSSFIKMDIRDCEGAKYQTDNSMSEKDFIGYIMFSIAKIMQIVSMGRQKKVSLDMEETTIDLISYYVELFTPVFRANPNSTYWKWLYGALLSGKEFSMTTIEGILAGANDSLYEKLINVLERVYEKDIINVDNLSKLFDDSSVAESEIILDEEHKIKASTLNRLVARVCDQNNSGDSKFTDTFLVTYRSFCTPETLLTLMMSYFEYHVLPKGDQEINSNNKTLVLRMLNTIRLWVQDHSYDFNNCLNASMMHFIYQQVGRLCVIEKTSNSGYISIANKIKERIEANLVCNGESREKLEKMFSRERPQPKYPSKWSEAYEKKSFSIKQWDAQEIAKQITLLDSAIFTAIEPKEFFGLGWTKKDKMVRAPNIVHLTDQFNNLSMFVASDIACEENLKKRLRKVKQWINVAWECKNLNNLNGCNSIVSAFNNAGIHRLKKTWDAIPKKDIENDRLRQLNELVAMTSSYKNMREHMSRSGEGIPYIGIYLTDMVFIEDGNKDYITKENTDLQLINFAKRRKIAEVIQRIKTQQQTLYDFIPIPFLQRTFDFSSLSEEEKSKMLLSDDVIWNKSLLIEPRENK